LDSGVEAVAVGVVGKVEADGFDDFVHGVVWLVVVVALLASMCGTCHARLIPARTISSIS
jgi:hypothetical protein